MILLRLALREPAGLHTYRVAGVDLGSDVPLPALEPFATPLALPAGLPPFPLGFEETGAVVFQGNAPLGSRERRVEALAGEGGTRVRVDEEAFVLSSDGSRVWRVEGPEGADPDGEVVLGPVLSLALALRGVFCLHAAAVAVGGVAIALAGDSGAGKSTLATLLAEEGWLRAADDILPVDGGPEGIAACPRFPQLKLAAAEQPGSRLPERLPLAAVYLLKQRSHGVRASLLRPVQAIAHLVRQTVAARLFAPDLLVRHADFCAHVVGRVPVRELAYPRERDIGPLVRAAIAADLHLEGAA
jgi:hypothetical protein